MRFAKRRVNSINVQRCRESIYLLNAAENEILTVFAHEDGETNSQLLGIEIVNTKTGEVTTQRINLPVTDMYIVSIKEMLNVESGVLDDLPEWRPKQ